MTNQVEVLSMSGGKDSTAMMLLAVECGVGNMEAVFCDTGHEHPATYEYLEYLSKETGIEIRTIKADFTKQIEHKKEVVNTKWRKDGVPEDVIETALSALVPTGIPFLDMCLWKGRFPSTKARFCTQELKVRPIIEQVFMPHVEAGKKVVSWQGIRADESPTRAKLPEREIEFGDEETQVGIWNYRPILTWTVDDVFDMHKRHNIKPNPLYKEGMGRVGCMPCINARKAEVREICNRFPDEVERVFQWEKIVAKASKRGNSNFFHSQKVPWINSDELIESYNINDVADWSRTGKGGRNLDLFFQEKMAEEGCSSIYGLCE